MDIHMEYFTSNAEVLRICRSRKKNKNTTDYLKPDYGSIDEWFHGVSSSKELEERILGGSKNVEEIQTLKKYSMTADTSNMQSLCDMFLDVAGGSVDVPLYLSGVPTHMHMMHFANVKSNVIKLGLDMGVLCDIRKEDFNRATRQIAKEIIKVERGGYRVKMTAICDFCNGSTAWTLAVLTKKETEALNYPKLLFATDASFFRGLGFGWMSRNGAPYMRSLGHNTDREINRDTLYDMYSKVLDLHKIINVNDMINMVNTRGDEETEKYLDGVFLG